MRGVTAARSLAETAVASTRMATTASILIAALSARDVRVTRPRRAICEVLADNDTHDITAAELHSRVIAAGSNVDASTVYRTLDLLEREGLITHVHLGHGPGSYHVAGVDEVHHLVCDRCGSSAHLSSDSVERVLQPLLAAHGFTGASAHFGLVALCAACAADEHDGR